MIMPAKIQSCLFIYWVCDVQKLIDVCAVNDRRNYYSLNNRSPRVQTKIRLVEVYTMSCIMSQYYYSTLPAAVSIHKCVWVWDPRI